MARRQTSSQQLVRRVQIILQMAQGKNNQQVGREMGIHRETVRQWRERWLHATDRLLAVEATADDKQLMQLIESVLADEPRPGTPAHFSLEQIVEILAIACEKPDASGYPFSHWTPQALRAQAIQRSIVEHISVRHVGRFLKRGGTATAPKSLLAKCRP
jgi:putative transposase